MHSHSCVAGILKTCRACSLLTLLPALCLPGLAANAQLGPIQSSGFLEYQYQQNTGPDLIDSVTQLGTWRGNAATYLWTPWILKVDGAVGVTRTVTDADIDFDGRRESTLLTGRLNTGLFQQSPFPVRAYVERLDSRVDSTIADLGLQTTTIGTVAQFAPRGGGSYSVIFRSSENDRLANDATTMQRAFSDSIWQVSLNKTLGRNDLRLTTLLGKTDRYEQRETLQRTAHNLRHKFRTSPRFYTDSTFFVSSESFDFDDSENLRKFQQFNGIATWRPETSRPLIITTRALLQGIETDRADLTTDSQSMAMTALVSYQKSERTTWSADVGITDRDADIGTEGSALFQRLRANYRSDRHLFGDNSYRWGSVLEIGNRHDLDNGDGDVKDALLRVDHSISRNVMFRGDNRLQVSFAQQLTAAHNNLEESLRVFSNSIFGTYSNQSGQVSTYVRLSATDRRSLGDQRAVNQLLNLQASTMAQAGRHRAWNGSITVQLGRSELPTIDTPSMRRESVSYSADLMYRHANLFSIPSLNFVSELRLLSEDFIVADPLEAELGIESERVDSMWRNRLSYRIGLLEFDLHATFREINDALNTRVFFKVRRYYGSV